ncbi:MAG: elongation factor P maturation arginine rhamnosyltransferase EarP, partial [Cupriavidus sp.]|nr:elongation factor P maturation arginine rhamnosyltransferase EarP [Cupriavidus sp.]
MQIRSWDIFCTVIDNFGDIGVCWRLARQLAAERGLTVRLWVDEMRAFHVLCPTADTTAPAQLV